MIFDLLHFGDGPQAINYFIFCLVAILGTLQAVAVRYARGDLVWFEGQGGYGLSALMIVGSFIWFFVTDKEIFIPGLAGGELFTIFVVAFIVAVPITRLVAFAFARIRALTLARTNPSEKEPSI